MGDKMAMFRTYTETYDLNTEEGCPTVLAIHTPIGQTPYKMLAPAFKMYKKYKYVGCDVTIVNAAKLPVDPEQVGRLDGENYVDPRDMLNPILFKGCHGESLGKILDSMYNGLLRENRDFDGPDMDKKIFRNALQNFYYTALGDDSWRKSHIQKTLQIRNLHPLVYQLDTNHQILPSNALSPENYSENQPTNVTTPALIGDTAKASTGAFKSSNPAGWESPTVGPTLVANQLTGGAGYYTGLASMFTGKMHRLGWLDTYQFLGNNANVSPQNVGTNAMIAELPKLFMGMVMLPGANLVRQYLRVMIRHKFKFAQYRTITTGAGDQGDWDVASGTLGYHNNYTGNVPTSKIIDAVEDPALDREELEGDDLDGN